MKSSSLSLWITSFLGSLLINSTCLAIPTVIPYQGRISVSGAAHTGPGAFRFALTNQNGSSTYWRSDTNPGDQVMAQVVAGDFEIHVGDSAITNMADIPLSVFDNSPLYLRVWFTDTVNPEFELTPAVRLLAAPYAIMARAVEDNSIDTAMIQDGAISGNKLANGSVGIGQLVNGSITTDKLVTGSVGTAQLASGAVDTNILTNSSVTTDKLANGSVTSAKIADDAVTGDHIGFGVIDTQHIANATITSSDIASNTISSNELQSSSVDSDEIASGAVTTVKLGNLVVTTTKIANASVTGPKLTTDALENYGGDVSADAVTAGSIHWAAPKTYRKFIHGGDFHAFQINEESSSALHRVEPFTIRPNKDKPTLFRASFHLPHGATVTGLKFYFDILDTSQPISLEVGLDEEFSSYAAYIERFPISAIVGTPLAKQRMAEIAFPTEFYGVFVDRIWPLSDYTTQLIDIPVANQIGVVAGLSTPFSNQTTLCVFEPAGETIQYPIVDNENFVYYATFEWDSHHTIDTTGSAAIFGRGVYGFQIEYQIGGL